MLLAYINIIDDACVNSGIWLRYQYCYENKWVAVFLFSLIESESLTLHG